MQPIYTKTRKRLAILCAALLMCCYCYAFGPGGDEVGNENPDAAVPFDGGVSLLLAAGVAYGAKKGYDAKRHAGTKKL